MRILLLLVLLLTGCTRTLNVKSDLVEKVPLNISSPVAIDAKPVLISVQNDLICMSDNYYKNLVFNMTLIQNWIMLENQVLGSYKNYYETP